jgi:two-component system NtrC family sensor kinase
MRIYLFIAMNDKKTLKQIDMWVAGRKLVKDYQTLSHRILELANLGVFRLDFMREVSSILMNFSGCDMVELRMKAHGKYYRFQAKHGSSNGDIFEIMDCAKDKHGVIVGCFRDESCEEILCRDIFLGDIDNSLPFFSPGGSYWTGDREKTKEFLSSNNMHCARTKKNREYHSFALIPLVEDGEKVGMIVLGCKMKHYFGEEEIGFYEDLAKTLVVAASHRMAQIGLRERVKELTCLYGISRLAEQSGASLEKVIQGIVELLPPAWLYPESACARIILDGRSYEARDFKQGPQKQSAAIVVGGERKGIVEIAYTTEKIELDEGPFLFEERKLIDTIAREIALIIEERKADEERLGLEEQLRHADRLATIGQLSAGVAHELNEPLANILGFAQLVKKNEKLPHQAKKDIERIERSSLHAREVIKKLMIFARQMPPQKTDVDLNKIVEEGLYFLESRCAKEGVKVARALASVQPQITADPSQITQVIVNLVVNAIQAMPNGGKLLIQTVDHKDHVSLVIEDTGIGMSCDVLSKIFIPFFTTKELSKGTGLGLSVVHGIVTSHGGTIEVRSTIGHGSRFEVKFPRANRVEALKRGKNDKKK